MSHGSSEKCEPNLTPLLDLVLQLVMFFMLCANFSLDQTNVDIKLPEALSAKSIPPGEQYVLFLNVNQKGEVLFPPGFRPLVPGDDGKPKELDIANVEQLKIILNRRAKEDREAFQRDKGRELKPDEPLRTLIILRVHKACPFGKTSEIMRACRLAGYLRVQLRAELGTGN